MPDIHIHINVGSKEANASAVATADAPTPGAFETPPASGTSAPRPLAELGLPADAAQRPVPLEHLIAGSGVNAPSLDPTVAAANGSSGVPRPLELPAGSPFADAHPVPLEQLGTAEAGGEAQAPTPLSLEELGSPQAGAPPNIDPLPPERKRGGTRSDD